MASSSVCLLIFIATGLLAQQIQAVRLFANRDFAQAEKAFRLALKNKPQNPELKVYLARTLIELNRTPEALSLLEQTLASNPSPEIEFEIGQIMRSLAEKRFQQLGQSDAGQAAVLQIAGRRLEREGQFDSALARYREALQLEPARPGLHYEIGSVLWKTRDYPQAEKHLRLELSRTPSHGMANFRLGQIMLATDREAEAVAPLELATTALANRLEVRRELGKAYRKAGRLPEARAAWEAIATARPEDDQVHFLLGGLYREMGEAALSEKEFNRHRQLLEAKRARSERR